MVKFKLEEIPVKDMQAIGLHDGEKLLAGQADKRDAAKRRTNPLRFIHFKDLKIEGASDVSLDAKLSLRRKPDGLVGLFVHPIYRERMARPNLGPEENRIFSQSGPCMLP